MRTVKFRGRRLDNGKWEYGDLLQYDDGSVCIGVHSKNYTDDGFNAGQYLRIALVDEDTVGQYVEMNDTNGNDIYEGDIVNYVYCGFDRRGEVRYDNSLCGFDFIDKDGLLTIISSYEARTYCIIGNIHDNPELLKGGQQ